MHRVSRSGVVAITLLLSTTLVALGGPAGAEPAASGLVRLATPTLPSQLVPFLYSSISCPSPGACVAVGPGGSEEAPAAAGTPPWVVAETSGTWGQPMELQLPTSAATESVLWPGITSLSCPEVGECVAVGGFATTPDGAFAPMVESESSGTWSSEPVLAAVGSGSATGSREHAALDHVDCPEAGDCVAVGTEVDTDGLPHLFVDVETAGAWGAATELAMPTLLTSKDAIDAPSITCSDLLDCVAVVAIPALAISSYEWTESAGSWSSPVAVSSAADNFDVEGVACPDPTTCIAVGGQQVALLPGARGLPAFAVERDGVWSSPRHLPLPRLSPVASFGTFSGISCDTDATCEAGGAFVGFGSGSGKVLPSIVPGIATWSNGSWSSIGYVHLPAVAGSLLSLGSIGSFSCPSTAGCVALGEQESLSISGIGAASYAVTLTPSVVPSRPGPPNRIEGSQLRGGVVARWSPPFTDGGSPILHFRAHVEPGGGSCSTTGYSCRIRGLVDGRRYHLFVADQTSTGTSLEAHAAHLVVAGLSPDPPGGVRLAAGHGRAQVRWRAARTLPGEPVLRYLVTLTGPGQLHRTLATRATSCDFGGVSRRGTYRVVVVAVNVSGPSRPSAAASARVTEG